MEPHKIHDKRLAAGIAVEVKTKQLDKGPAKKDKNTFSHLLPSLTVAHHRSPECHNIKHCWQASVFLRRSALRHVTQIT